jgi:S1-C subfamily serine protease
MKLKYLLAPIVALFFLLQTPIRADFLTDEEKTIAASQKLLAATVKIDPEPTSQGTGFYISRDTIITNEHVIHKSNSDIHFTRYDGIQCTGKVGYREEGKETDLALIHTDRLNDNVLKLAESVKIGQSIVTVGNPGSFDFTVSKGIVSALREDRVQFDARVDFGSSGGVVADLGGNVVGVEVEMSKSDNYVAFAIPANRVRQFLDRAEVK